MPDRRRESASSGARQTRRRARCCRADTPARSPAEGAVHVADLQRQEQPQLAPALHDDLRRLRLAPPLDAVDGAARSAGSGIPCTRTSSGDTVDATKLNWPIGQRYLQNVAPENTTSIASAAPKYAITRYAVALGQRPEIEQLVAEQHGDEKRDADPLGAQPPRPVQPRRAHAPARVADEHERTPHAEQIAGREQRDDQQAAVVHPRQDRREIGRVDSGPKRPSTPGQQRRREATAAAPSGRGASAGSRQSPASAARPHRAGSS